MRSENIMISKNNQKTSRLASWGILLTGRMSIPPPAIVDETRHHSAISIGRHTGTNHGFGAEENDWLGAEAYVEPLR
jgi:hypothetical protein